MWPVRQPGDGREFVIVELLTDAGVRGWGEAACAGGGAAVVRRFEAIRPFLLGLDATAAEAARLTLHEAGRDRGGADYDVQGAVNKALEECELNRAQAEPEKRQSNGK